MAEGFFYVPLPATAKTSLVEGKDALIVSAESSAEAVFAARAYLHLPSDAAWTASTPVELAHSTDLEGWRLRILIVNPATSAVVEDVTVTATAGHGTNDIGALMQTALNATSSISAAAFSTPNLVIAAGSGADDLGDMAVTVSFLPPATWSDPTIDFPEFWNTVVDEGSSSADLSVVLVVAVVAPTVMYQLGTGH